MTPDGQLPPEITHMRQWLRDLFAEASRGLPWPQQAGLLVVEQALVAGMFGGLMISAQILEEAHRHSSDGHVNVRLLQTLQSLETVALGPLPAQIQTAIRFLQTLR